MKRGFISVLRPFSFIVLVVAVSCISVLAVAAPSTYTVDQVATAAFSLMNTGFGTQKTFPSTVTIAGTAVPKHQYFILAAKAIKAIYDGGSSSSVIQVTNPAEPTALDFRDQFNMSLLTKTHYMNTVTRNISYASTHSTVASHVIYPSSGYESFEGNFSFNRGCFVYTKILKEYKVNNSLPDDIDCGIPQEYTNLCVTPQPSQTFTVEQVIKAAVWAQKEVDVKGGALPASIKVGSVYNVTRPAFLRLMYHAVVLIHEKRLTETIPYYSSCATPSSGAPLQNLFKRIDLNRLGYIDVAKRQLAFMNKTLANQHARFVLEPFQYAGEFTYEKGLRMFPKVLSYYCHNGELPVRADTTKNGNVSF